MRRVKALQDNKDFVIKQGSTFAVKFDHDLKPYIIVKRRCYLTNRLKNNEFEVIKDKNND